MALPRRRRRCSIIASAPPTSERALPPVAGSISGTLEGAGAAAFVPIVHAEPSVGEYDDERNTGPPPGCTA